MNEKRRNLLAWLAIGVIVFILIVGSFSILWVLFIWR